MKACHWWYQKQQVIQIQHAAYYYQIARRATAENCCGCSGWILHIKSELFCDIYINVSYIRLCHNAIAERSQMPAPDITDRQASPWELCQYAIITYKC